MGGTIWVESEKNNGAQFYITIPFDSTEITSSELPKTMFAKAEEPEFNGEKILVVDDHTSSFVFISEMFEDQNVAVLQAKNGEEGIALCKANPEINLVLMDIQMGGLNGVEAMQQIKKSNSQIPVVAQTAFAQKGDRERFMEQGFDEYITKPLDERELQGIFKRFLKK